MPMFTKDENEDLDIIAIDLAYSSLRFSKLYLKLENDEWDRFSKELADVARMVINSRIQQRIDALATENDYTTLVTE